MVLIIRDNMKEWSVYIQLNGDCVSEFYTIDFKVPEALYAKIQKAIESGKSLSECSFYADLYNRAEAAAEKQIDKQLKENAYGPKPKRSEYSCREEYEDELEEYMSSDSIENYYMVSFNIYDPNIEKAFINKFVGRVAPKYAKGEAYTEDFSYEIWDEICATYDLTVHFDADGTITDITNISGSALESEDVRGSSYSDVEPDYEYIAESLEEDLFEED